MGALLMAAYVLSGVLGIVSLVCFVLVLVEMFRREQTGLAIACIVLALCSGIGVLIAFVYGWIKAGEWNLKKVMTGWTVCCLVQLVIGAGAVVALRKNIENAVKVQNEVRREYLEKMEKEAKDVDLEIKIE
jgi:hypothetical protein